MHTRLLNYNAEDSHHHRPVSAGACMTGMTPIAIADVPSNFALGCGPVTGCIVRLQKHDKMAIAYVLNPLLCD